MNLELRWPCHDSWHALSRLPVRPKTCNGDMESACSLPLRLGSFGLEINLLLNLGENALPLT